MAELPKARSMQPYIILYKTTLQLGVRNLPKVFTRQRPDRESNRVSVIRPRHSTLVSATKLLPVCRPSVAGYKGIQVDRDINE